MYAAVVRAYCSAVASGVAAVAPFPLPFPFAVCCRFEGAEPLSPFSMDTSTSTSGAFRLESAECGGDVPFDCTSDWSVMESVEPVEGRGMGGIGVSSSETPRAVRMCLCASSHSVCARRNVRRSFTLL